jgi:hypothetical protein
VSAFNGDQQHLRQRHYKDPATRATLFVWRKPRHWRRPESALSAFRRNDIAQLRILLQEGEPALLLYLQLLAKAMQRLDARSAESIHRFKRRIRAGLEAF